MDYPHVNLCDLTPSCQFFTVTVKVDVAFNYETMDAEASEDRPAKILLSFDVVFFDRQGTRMMAKMEERAVRDLFMGMMSVGSNFEIAGLWVCRGSEGLDSRWHLRFNDTTVVKEIVSVFPEIPFSLYSCAEVAARLIGTTSFLDIVGYVKVFSRVTDESSFGFPDKEFTLVLGACVRGNTWSRDELRCVLRGAWVGAARQMIVNGFKRMDKVFVYLRYVELKNPLSADPVLVVSWMNASTLQVDPEISYVQALKEAMLDEF